MSRSKHTDPKTIRAARRLRAPQAARGAGDLSRRRKLGRNRKKVEAIVHDERRPGNGWSRLRIVERRPRNGYHHPAGKQDVLKMLNALGPVAVYGLRSVELTCAPANAPASAPLFGRYQVPGRIVLFEQPMPPWRLPGVLKRRAVRRLERAGAVVTLLSDVGGTLVDWPHDTLRRFMLEDVLLHELGHHVLQHYKGKRRERIARTRDHEAFAARFADKQRVALKKGNCH